MVFRFKYPEGLLRMNILLSHINTRINFQEWRILLEGGFPSAKLNIRLILMFYLVNCQFQSNYK